MKTVTIPALLAVLTACGPKADSGATGSSASAQRSTATGSSSAAGAKSASMAAPTGSTSAAASDGPTISDRIPPAPVLGKAGEGFATFDDALGAVADAMAREDVTAFDVGTPTAEQLAAFFGGCEAGKPSMVEVMEMKRAAEVTLKNATAKRPYKLSKWAEGEPIQLKVGDEYGYCKVAAELDMRVVGFLFAAADGANPFVDGGFGLSFYKLGGRFYLGPPK
ncbi:MAG: hypothetical protein U0271_21210 [Polyangiaceae bacterium]